MTASRLPSSYSRTRGSLAQLSISPPKIWPCPKVSVPSTESTAEGLNAGRNVCASKPPTSWADAVALNAIIPTRSAALPLPFIATFANDFMPSLPFNAKTTSTPPHSAYQGSLALYTVIQLRTAGKFSFIFSHQHLLTSTPFLDRDSAV